MLHRSRPVNCVTSGGLAFVLSFSFSAQENQLEQQSTRTGDLEKQLERVSGELQLSQVVWRVPFFNRFFLIVLLTAAFLVTFM